MENVFKASFINLLVIFNFCNIMQIELIISLRCKRWRGIIIPLLIDLFLILIFLILDFTLLVSIEILLLLINAIPS